MNNSIIHSYNKFSELKKRNFYKLFIIVLLLIITLIIFFFSLSNGSVELSMNNIFTSIASMGKAENSHIIWNIRLPRIITAILVGASLSLSGAILQAVMRNPLASPGIIGVNAGAGLGATIIIIAMPIYFYYIIPAAFLGSLITSLAIYLLAWQRGARPTHLILAGIAVASFVSSLTSSIMIAFPERIHGTVDFMIGSLMQKHGPT